VFKSTFIAIFYGNSWWDIGSIRNLYCDSGGNCVVNSGAGKAVYRYDNQTPPCYNAGTCIWLDRTSRYDVVVYVMPSGKQGILTGVVGLYRSPFCRSDVGNIFDDDAWEGYIYVYGYYSPWYFGRGSDCFPYEFYSPLNNTYFKMERDYYGYISLYESHNRQLLFTNLVRTFRVFSTGDYWIGGDIMYISYEASPELIMPIDYSEYVLYKELRRVVGWSVSGRAQVGWNAEDILRVVQELFPDRPWLVYDDSTYTLYSNGLDIDDILELGKYVSVVNEALEIRVLNDKIPKDKVRQFIDFYKRQHATPQPQ